MVLVLILRILLLLTTHLRILVNLIASSPFFSFLLIGLGQSRLNLSWR